jgi:hypothetical protein
MENQIMSTISLEKAQTFIWNNARLLERQLFSFLFNDGSRQNVLRALVAYQNSDGGFGNALEPDKRTPSSQPIDQEFSLRILDDIGFDEEVAGQICDFLSTITTAEGGVPFVLPTVSDAPRAPWWNTEDNPPASINPTASIAGLLNKHKVQHPWLDQATEFCWQKIEALLSASDNDLLSIILFLENAPDKDRATREFEPIGEIIKKQVALDPLAEGYVHKPLDWAPSPTSLCSGLFDASLMAPHLEALAAKQQPDGGWPISWPAISPASLLEYRGVVTIKALKTLEAYDYLV